MTVPFDFAHPACLGRLQEVQNHFSETTSMAAVLVSPDGTFITQTSLYSNFYCILLNSEKGYEIFMEAVRHLVAECEKKLCPATMVSHHTGLHLAAVPLVVQDKLQACWVVGQVRGDNHLDYYDPYMIQLGIDIGVSSHVLKMLVCELPYVSVEDFNRNMDFLEAIANLVSHDVLAADMAPSSVRLHAEPSAQLAANEAARR